MALLSIFTGLLVRSEVPEELSMPRDKGRSWWQEQALSLRAEAYVDFSGKGAAHGVEKAVVLLHGLARRGKESILELFKGLETCFEAPWAPHHGTPSPSCPSSCSCADTRMRRPPQSYSMEAWVSKRQDG